MRKLARFVAFPTIVVMFLPASQPVSGQSGPQPPAAPVNARVLKQTVSDSTRPTVSITAPASGATVAGTVNITANASDNVGVAAVHFNIDGVNLGSEVLTAPYQAAWNTRTVLNGLHTLTAIARDAAGNVTASSPVNVTIANGVVTVTLSPQDTTLNLDAVNYSAGPQLTAYTSPDNQVGNAILMKFDFSAFPPGTVVQQATLNLSLVASDTFAEPTYTITANKVLAKNPVIAAATGYTSDGVTPWTPNTCCLNGVPMAQADISAPYDTRAVDKSAGVKSWNLSTMVREWMASPATNFGVLLDADATKLRDRHRDFASVENANVSTRPILTVLYVPPADSTPPVISGVASSSITVSAATISWTTNEFSDSQVEYGTTTAYGSTTALQPDLLTAHTVALSGLTSTTLYHFRVRSKDGSANLATSGDFTFTTAGVDTTPPTVSMTAPAAGVTVTGTITVSADASDNVAVAGVQFRSDAVNIGVEDTTAPYAVSWDTTKVANGNHTINARARDAAGNSALSASVIVTVFNDKTPPVLSAITAVSITSSGATITWTTDEAATSQVDYGTSTAYTNTTGLDANLVVSHSATLTGLSANTVYHYRVRSRDASGNLATSGDFTFTTLP
jgi:Bacterial Ig domain/Purple acid Phosphatase, N-terminal domain